MLDDNRDLPALDTRDDLPTEEQRPKRGWSAGRVALWSFAAASLMFLALASVTTWRWLDNNLLHWGVADKPEQTVDRVELLRRIQAFELATIKHTYSARAHVEAPKELQAGPQRVSLPLWAAGQQLDVKAKVTVTAGVDLSRVRPEDMEVIREGRDTRVIIHVPAPQVLSTELVPNSMDMSTRTGVLTRIGQAVGKEETDLRDRAADEVGRVARDEAIQQGILDEAARETERRLQDFLQALPQTGGRVIYVVKVEPVSGQ